MKVVSLSTFIFIFLCTFSYSANADINSVEATIDRNPVMLDEAIRLTVTADGSADRDAFDSSPLLKDFVVGRTSVSSQTSIVNFDTKRTTVWTTTLFPRKEGTFTIPALSVEGKSTKPIRVKVIPVQEQGQGSVARDYYVTTDIDLKEAYLNQQLLYTVKLYLSGSIERGSLQAPEMQNADIKQLGEDKQYSDIVNGKRYQIIERQFAVIPQASGEFTLRGPIFTGEVLAPNTNQRFGFFNRTQQINRVGPDITITIKPIPQGIDYPWLPSEMVRVDEEWPQGDQFIAGEPVTRIVTLTALGVVEEQLPDIPEFYPPSFKLYPDQSTTTTVERDQNLISQRQTSLAIIPTQPGSYVLPEVTIPWFNTLTEKTEYATIAARTINVVSPNAKTAAQPLAPSATSNTATDVKENDNVSEKNAASLNENETNAAAQTTPETSATDRIWFYTACVSLLVSTLLLVGWIYTGIKLRRIKRLLQSPSGYVAAPQGNQQIVNNTESDAFKFLLKTLTKQDVKASEGALVKWLAALESENKPRALPGNIPETKAIKPHFDALVALRFSPSQANVKSQSNKQIFVDLLDAVKTSRKQWLDKESEKAQRLSTLYPAG